MCSPPYNKSLFYLASYLDKHLVIQILIIRRKFLAFWSLNEWVYSTMRGSTAHCFTSKSAILCIPALGLTRHAYFVRHSLWWNHVTSELFLMPATSSIEKWEVTRQTTPFITEGVCRVLFACVGNLNKKKKEMKCTKDTRCTTKKKMQQTGPCSFTQNAALNFVWRQ